MSESEQEHAQQNNDLNFIDKHFPIIDKTLRIPLIFSLIVISQGLLGGLGLPSVPERISRLSQNAFARFFFVTLIAYTATQDIETAVFSVVIFFALMRLARTPAELAKVPYF